MSFYCQPCRMQVDDMASHKAMYHGDPVNRDGGSYTLAEARQRLQEMECAERGHSWDIVETHEGPTALICRCGVRYAVTAEVVQPEVHCDCGKSYVGAECFTSSTASAEHSAIERDA